MITAARFLLYSIFTSLARAFIDRQVKRNAEAIFAQLDPKIPSLMAVASPAIVEAAAVRAIQAATGLASVDQRQVAQVLDLFNPAFAAGRASR